MTIPRASTVLVVGRDIEMFVILRPLLERAGYSVMTASTAKRGAQLYRRQPAHLVIVDMGTPDMDAFDLLWQLYEQDPEANVIAISADEDVLIDARNVGADVTLVKPLHVPTVLEAVAWLLAGTGVLP